VTSFDVLEADDAGHGFHPVLLEINGGYVCDWRTGTIPIETYVLVVPGSVR
jgi:hypothetical protein